MPDSLADWLRWQEALNPQEIDLGLDRIREVADRLPIEPPRGSVFTVAGTNGKGSTVAALEKLLIPGGYRVGRYTSPHLVRYNERICVAGIPVSDAALISAFERIEAARAGVSLTYFEFGTLAAAVIFSAERCAAWVLEVGLGGRLDAVNVIDPAFSLITTIALDHEDWLGTSVEQIAAEKAGILRTAAPAFFGDVDTPAAITARADELGTRLRRLGHEYSIERSGRTWSWRGEVVQLPALRCPTGTDDTDLRNLGLAMAAVEQFDPALLSRDCVEAACASGPPPGRFQQVSSEHQWLLDVAHNPQAARVLRRRIDGLDDPRATTAVIGMLADKRVEAFVAEFADTVDHWVVATLAGPRAKPGAVIAARIEQATGQRVHVEANPVAAFERALRLTPRNGRIICCGSFQVVGPAREWLGLYS